jgi:hypothetical protein
MAKANIPYKRIAAEVGCSPGYARLIAVGKADLAGNNQSRFAGAPVLGRSTKGMPPIDHPAIQEARTIFRGQVLPVNGTPVLKSGHNSAKIGKVITKGKWAGFPVYTLTLEERATCPTSCKHWRSCYGNNMHFAQRYAHGEALEIKIVHDVAALYRQHQEGFVVRLHVLGDFYSVRYVQLWSILLDECPALHAFGFSARWDYHNDPIAKALVDLVRRKWDRFAIRFSNAPVDECSTVSIEHPFQKPSDAIICPQQLGQTSSYSTCGLCWQSRRRIAFVQH